MLFPTKHWARLSSLNVSLIGSMPSKILVKTKTKLRYYAAFKVRKFESLFLHCIAGKANILSKYIIYIIFDFGRGFCRSPPTLFPKTPASCCKKI